MGNKVFSASRVWALLTACLISATAAATPEVLDWDALTWTPEGNTNLSETFTTGSGDITFTFGGNVADLDQAGPVISPAINAQNTGGLVPVQNGLYVATDYVNNSNPMVTVTVDFTGYPGGVGNLSFMVFDMDSGGTFIDDMTVIAQTASGPTNPTSIVTSAANTQIGANTVRGTSGSAATSANGNATFVFGDAGTPVSGITQVVITWRNLIGTANPGFQWINIHDFVFDDPMADTELTKTVLPATASAGETVVFTLDIVNNGPDDAPSVQVTDQLPAGFAYVSDNGGGSYNPGSGIWDVGTLTSSGTAQLTIDATMQATGPWDNSAEVTRLLATDPDSTPDNDVAAEDDQDNAAVTLVTPEIGVAKRVLATPVNNGDGTYTLTYSILVANSGDVALSNVQVVDDLATTFTGTAGFVIDSVTSGDFTTNAGFDGSSDTNVLAGSDTLAVGVSGTVDVTVTVDAGGTLGPFDNTANGSGTSPGGTGIGDASTTGSNPDPDGDGNPGNNSVPTSISFTENPQIGVAKAVSAGPVNNGDGSYTLDYRFTLENFGDGPLNNVQIVDNLATTFAGATGFVVDSVTSSDFTPNPGFDGVGDTNVLAGTDSMILAATGTVNVTVTVSPGGTLGPYDNNSFARGQSPGGALSIDNSVNGLDPDPDGNGDPVDDNSPTPVSFAENPEIGLAKRVSATPVNNGDGTYTLTYSMVVANSGDVTLNNVQVVDNLAATFAAATGFVVDSVTSADFAVNAGYDGNGDTNLLAGTDSLVAAASGTVDVTVTVTPGGTLGPYNNTATGSGTSPGGTGVNDVSTTGSNPDPDGDGNPGNNSVPTAISFTENPEIGLAKALSAGPVNNGDGTYTLTYRFTLESFGDVPLNNVEVVDNLASTFSGATGFVVDSVTSGDFTPNPGFDGAGDTNVLTGTDTLALGATGTVDVTVTVTPGGNSGPYDNSAFARGQGPGGTLALDVSVDGFDPDPDGNGDPVDNLSPTPVSFAENPEIGTAKTISAGPTNNGDGTHTLTYTLTLENSGDVALNSVQLVDNLAATFAGATGFVVDSVTSADFATNPGFDGIGDTNVLAGSDSLAIAATGTVDVTVTVTPGGNLGPYDNTATGSGTSPGGMGVSDDSTAGNDPDPDGDGNPGNNTTPTPVSFAENPEIGTAKAISAGPTNNGDGTHTLTYTLTLENSGDVALNSVQLVDNLAATFAGATGFVVDSVTSADFATNPGFDGIGDTNVLAGTDSLAITATGTVDVTVTVTPGGSLGPYNNTATGSGTSPGGMGVSDDSTAGNDPDPDGDGNPGNNTTPTPVIFGENPQIGVAKAVTAGPVNNGDGTYTLTYTMTLENFGDVVLDNLQATDNLAGTFAGATAFVVDSVTSADFTANAGFDGSSDTNVLAGTDSLAIAATGTVDVTVTVTPGGSLGPYDNTVFAQGSSPAGGLTFDNSVDGLDPDPDGNGDPVDNLSPTPVSFAENPEIGTAKAISAGPTNNGDGTHTVTYTLTLENSGDVALNSVQLVDNLAATFAGATGFVVDSVTSADFATNPGFDGIGDTNVLAGSDSLAIAATGTVDVTVTVTPGGNLGPYDNTATGSGTSPGGMGVSDDSTAGNDPDPDGDGNPGNNTTPTPVSFAENPEIGTAKAISAGPTNNGDGTYTLTYTMTLENSGDVTLNNVQVVDNLAATFAGATGFVVDSVTSGDFTINPGFDGSGDTNMLAGTDSLPAAATGTVDVTVTVTPGGSLGPYNNTATGSGTSPGGMGVSDDSTDGNDPDPDGDGNPGNNTTPTPVSFAENPEIGTAKAISAGPTNNGDGTHTLTYTLTLENSGDVALNSVQLVDNLAATFAGATGFVVDSVTSADFATNPGFDGIGDTNVLAGTDSLAITATGTVDVTVTVTPGGSLGPYNNTATGSGTSPGGMGVSDDSTAGNDPDPDGDGNPGNNTTPTPVIFGENPQIGVAKAVTAGPVNNGDGTYTLTYTMTLENFGDVVLDNLQATDNLAGTFAGATAFVVDSVTSGDFTANPGFDGSGDTNLLAGTDSLAIAGTGTLEVTVTVTPGGSLGPFNNTAVAQGSSPAGGLTFDDSVNGLDPDPDGNGDPADNTGPTPVLFDENPQVGVAKALTTGPVSNGDGSYTLTYTMTLENFGDVVLDSLQITDNLATTFAGATGFVVDSVTSGDFTANPGFDGSGDTNLLSGGDSLAIAAAGTVDVTVTVTPGGSLGPYDNTVTAQGSSPAGMVAFDNSVDGLDADPDGNGDPADNAGPTPVTFAETPLIGTAKAVSGAPLNNGDGTFTLTYTIIVENAGDTALVNLQVVDDLAGTYAGATGFVVDSVTSTDFVTNPGYDGVADTDLLAGSDTLAIAATGSIAVTLTVTPGGNLGPYDNTATGSATSPGGTGVNDDSTTGGDADPDGDGDPGNNATPTTVIFGENPQIGVAKAVTAGPVNNGDGTHTLTYTMTVENFGDVVLDNLQVVDNLAATFAGATGFVIDTLTSADFAVNAAFDGDTDRNLLDGSDSLALAGTGAIQLTVTVTPGANLGPYDNAVFAQGSSPAGGLALDNSVDGLDPDPDGNGDPVDNLGPTPVIFGENPVIGTAKAASLPVNNGDGTFTLIYTIVVENGGDVVLDNVQVVEDLAGTFAAAAAFVVDSLTSADFAVNAGFDGIGDTNLLIGADTLAIAATGSIDLTVTVTPGANLGPYANTATGSSTSPGGTVVSDDSTTGSDPDPDGDGDPTNDTTPTTVVFGENPGIGTAKAASVPVNNGDGTYTLTYTIFVENSGDVTLNSVQVIDDVSATFAGASGFGIDSVTSAGFTVNPGFDGIGDTGLLGGSDSLAVAATGSIDVTVTVTPGGSPGPYDNSATASGLSPSGVPVSDVSTTGTDPDPGNDGPGDDNTPTPVTFDPGVSGISGSAWLDENADELFESDELPVTGWFVELLQNGVVIATVPVGADGSYSFDNVPPGSGYSVQLRHPTSNAVYNVVNDITLPPNVTVTDQNLPVDPSGVFYDTVTRLPVPGVLVSIVDSGGTPLPPACLLPGQQDQVTGADGYYRFDVVPDADPACASGATFGIVFTAPPAYVPGVSTLIPPAPGALDATGQPDPFRVQPQSGPPTGAASTLYYLSVTLSAGDPNIINNHIPIDPVAASANLNVSKRADRRQTRVGDLVLYTVTIENPGAAVTGLTLSDLIPAGFTYVSGSARLQPATGMTVTGQRPVVFDNIAVAAGGTTQLRYMLRVGAGVVQGDYTNTVTPLIGNTAVGNSASAIVTVTADPDFEQTTIVGMVFNDSNGDGWQDEGEAGIPGVRLATVEGLIIETDAFGRYHLAGVDGGRRDRGRNFIVKIDPASLPDGVEFTTENPRVQRITEGLLNRFDFGVRMPQSNCCKQIDVKIGEIFFEDGSSNVRPEFLPLVNQLADRLRESGGGTLFVEGHADPSEAVAYSSDAYTVTQHFAPRSTALRAEDKRELDEIIAQWRGVENVSVSAVGHTCNTPIAPANRKEFRDNYELSRARAQAVAAYVRVGLGIAPEQVSIAGKGPDEPIASNATPEGGAQNRRVELTISGQRATGAATPAELARDRANRVMEMLRDLLGDDLVRRIEIRTAPPAGDRRETEMTSDATPAWLRRGTGLLLGMLIGTAHADPLPQTCTVDSCRTDEGYAIQILPSSREPSPEDTRAARASDQRVDVSGRFWVPAGGGMLWATEDPSAAQPRLALHAPEVAPVEDGKLAMPVSFFVYSNYSTFIDKAEIQIYHGNDIDLIEPLDVVPFKPGVFSRIDWQPQQLSRPLNKGDELYYRVRAWDGDGHYDETHLEHLRLVGMDEYKRSAESDPELLLPEEAGMHKTSALSRGPLGGNVLVLQPPAATQYLTRGSYSVTPHFDTRKTVLKPEDRAELDRIAAEWAGARDLRLHVIGHTDNVRIAPEHRNEFRDNQALSEARARAVTDYVASRMNLDRTRITSEGRAAREPAASNGTAAGRAQNRRVELTISGERPAGAAPLSAGTTLVEPHSDTKVNITDTLEEALNLLGARLGDGVTMAAGGPYADATVAQSSAHALEAIYGRSDLRMQRIPVNGSRVRINGQDIGGNTALRINGEPVPLDASGKYAVEYLMPVGNHDFDVELIDGNGRVTDRRRLPVEVAGKHIFLVALADLTVSDNNVSGSVEPLRADDRYDDDLLVEGRLAFYLKGKIKGKYLITAQLDSQEEEIGDLFSNIFDKDPKSVLRRLDPDRYYPVYGDDSTTISDTNSQGRLYFRADWDRSSATWGNFHTGFTGNEFAQYNRSLYGAQYIHESLNVTAKGESKTRAIAFLSEAQTGFGHSEFVGTGGSLYYLKHQDILPGSEKAWVEIRDRDSDRVRELVTLVRGIDYEVDEIQGRIILSRPLMQVSRLNAPGIVKDTPLDGDELVLLVDYEYIPNGFSPDKVTVGGRGRHWVTDDIAVGATLVNENRETEDYTLLGGDILWQPGQGTYLKAEYAQSEASQADRFQSSDGGLTFDSATPVAAGRQGDAWGIEARINSRETLNTDNEWVGGGWYRRTDDNYSVARRDPGVDTTEYGLELTGHLSDRMTIAARGSVVERETLDRDRRLGLQIDYGLTDRSLLSGELRSVEETRTGTSADGMLLALRYSYSLSDAVEVYGIGQVTLENDSGRYDNNDLGTVGVSVDLNGSTTLQGEYSTGHRGEGALLSLDYRLDDRHEVYGTFTQSADRTDLREPGTRIALGHRSRITDQATLFNERQFIEDREQAGLTHVFGLDFDLDSGWAFGISMQSGDLETTQGNVARDAATLTANYRSQRLSWRGKAEYRNENGSSDVRQVLTTNRLDLKLSEDWRLLTRLSHSETEDQTLTDRDDSAVFTEAGVGFAYRPVANNRLNLLAKYTFLYDLPAPEQIDGGTDQRSHVVSLEGIYRLNPRWELGGKLAQRSGELRVDRDFGQWFESTTNFYALRGRYHLIRRWDAMLEYRSLDVDEAGSARDGWLVALDRHINDHFRLGVGYNFTDFSDDLTNLDYDHNGWFVNAVGKY